MTKTNILSELFAETGIKGSTVIWLLILNILRVFAVFIAIGLGIVWIITQDSTYGWALIWPALGILVTSITGFIIGAKMVFK